MSEEQSLTGVWTGEYWYGAGEGRTSFAAHITETGADLEGTTLEPASFISTGELSATISGARSGSEVNFVKVYDASSQLRLVPISYSGVADVALEVIEGTWILIENGQPFAGGFIMRRISGKKAAVKSKTKRAAKAPKAKELVIVAPVTRRPKPAKTK